MATNKDLLKEAIADAKAIRESALANAKAALEEAFTPQLKNMLSEKIQEISEEEKEEKMEEMKKSEDMYEGKEELEELNLDELLAELEGLEEEDETLMEAEKEDDDKESMKEAKDEEEDESEEKEEEEEDEEVGEMSPEELKDVVMDILKDLGVPFSEEAEDMDMDMDMEDAMPEEGEEGEEEELEEMVDVQSLLEELGITEEEDAMEEGYGKEEELEEGIIDWIKKQFAKADFSKVLTPFLTDNDSEIKKIMSMEAGEEKTTAANKLLNKFEAFAKEAGYGDEGVKRSDRSSLMAALKGKGLGGKTGTELGTDISKLKLEGELSEALETIETLRSEINEVNLLNAKLLYTNRIFKGKTLTGNQKVKVLETFDKATTVNEVKLIHETLSNSLNTSKKSINESVGSASKVMGTTKTKPIINENDAFSRMRELAFYSQKH